MEQLKEEDIREVITSILDSSDKELFDKTQEELEDHWFFDFDKTTKIDEYVFYDFYDKLKLYSHFCRRWEEHHNGHICVVGRVRDTYILPKIKKFQKLLKRLEED